ncbi:hypothetical protein chiPu_0030033, partial [Chiloscyllium punctatum]|nr:hypothetical protein [Chiloscyllium punctatum]
GTDRGEFRENVGIHPGETELLWLDESLKLDGE